MAVIKGLWELTKSAAVLGPALGIPVDFLANLKNEYKNNPKMDWRKKVSNAFDATGKDLGKIYKYITGAEKKNTGGMAYARKKNMGLKMNAGGSVKSKKSKKKSRGTGAAKRGTKFKGTF